MAVIITLLILGHSASTTIKFSTVHHHTQSTISDLLRQTMATCCCPSLRSHYAHSLRFGHCPHGPFRLKISLHYLQPFFWHDSCWAAVLYILGCRRDTATNLSVQAGTSPPRPSCCPHDNKYDVDAFRGRNFLPYAIGDRLLYNELALPGIAECTCVFLLCYLLYIPLVSFDIEPSLLCVFD